MKSRNTVRPTVKHLRALTIIASLAIVAAITAAPFYSAQSSSLVAPSAAVLRNPSEAAARPSRLGSLISSNSTNRLSLFTVPPPSPETIQTFAADCITPKTDFDLGATVCAKITGAPLGSGGRAATRIGWVSPYGSLAQGADITTDPQNGTYLIPTSQTQTITDSGGGTIVVDNRDTSSINTYYTGDGSLRASAYFTVPDHATPYVDLAVHQSATQQD